MGEIIKTFSDGSYLEYDHGSFDEWCVYLSRPSFTQRRPPRDTDYFSEIRILADKYTSEKLYHDFVTIYDLTSKVINDDTILKISEIANTYNDDNLEVDIIFSILYMAMIAEERKAYTRLGKRIKRLGMHVLLFEDYSINQAANFMRGKKWREIDALCRERGF